jgi:hypothetical protein
MVRAVMSGYCLMKSTIKLANSIGSGINYCAISVLAINNTF